MSQKEQVARAHCQLAFALQALTMPGSWIGIASILDLAICGGGRRPRSTVDGGRKPRSANGRDRRRPKVRHAMAPLRPAQAPAAFDYNRNRFCPVSPLRSGISGHRSSSHFRALLSAAPSPETLIPPLSLALPRLPSHVPSNTCCVRPLPSLPSSSPGTSTSAAHGIGGGGDDDDDDDDDG